MIFAVVCMNAYSLYDALQRFERVQLSAEERDFWIKRQEANARILNHRLDQIEAKILAIEKDVFLGK
jgi:hypothetical protein